MNVRKNTLMILISFLVFVLLFSLIIFADRSEVFADTTVKNGAVKDGPLNVRKGAGTNYAKIGSLKKGTNISILATIKNAKKETWSKIKSSKLSGYVLDKHIKKTGVIQTTYSPLRKGTAKSNLNIRKGAGTKYKKTGMYAKGKTFSVYAKTKNKSGSWYKVRYKSAYRYVSADYVVLSKNTTKTADKSQKTAKPTETKSEDSKETESGTGDFESELTAQGFPDSYKPFLRTLHKKHPKWVFKAQKTGISWTKVVSAEKIVGTNLVEPTSPESWKGMASGAYNFSTGKYTVFDGRWNQASLPLIKYYLDPRNGLNETNIYQFMTHKYSSVMQNKTTIKNIVSSVNGCFLDKAATITAIANAGKNSGVNPNVITALVIMEQGWKGTSGIVSGTYSSYKGIYNHFNICAYHTSDMNAVQHGLWWAKGAGKKTNTYGRPWNTVEKSLSGGAQFYRECYIDNKQNTYYLKKFNVMNGLSKLATHQYSTDTLGAMSEGQLVSRAYKKNDDFAIQFLIPVYESMPESVYKKPGTSGNNNCYLKNLSVTGYKISPAFDKYTTSYKLTVASDVSTVDVTAKQLYSKAAVSGKGKISLEKGINTVKVTVKATSGMKKTYTIAITRK